MDLAGGVLMLRTLLRRASPYDLASMVVAWIVIWLLFVASPMSCGSGGVIDDRPPEVRAADFLMDLAREATDRND